MNYNDISAEWKTLRQNMGNFFCHVNNMMTRIENSEKKMADFEHYREEIYLDGFNNGYAAACRTRLKQSDIDRIYSAISPESQRVIFAMAQKFLDLEEKNEE